MEQELRTKVEFEVSGHDIIVSGEIANSQHALDMIIYILQDSQLPMDLVINSVQAIYNSDYGGGISDN